jgi:microcystin-dependent protein
MVQAPFRHHLPLAFNPAVSGSSATPAAWNALLADIETGLSTTWCRDGQSTVTADIPMSNHKFTGLAPGSSSGDSVNKGQLDIAAPTGSVMPYAGSSAPTGWLLCYGQAVSRITYAALFAVTGTTYGTGDGSTTFNVPDLRGRVVAGQDDMGGTSANRLTGTSGGVDGDVLGAAGGLETHTLTEAQMPAHDHEYLGGQIAAGSIQGRSVYADGTNQSSIDTTSKGSSAAHNNVQPTFILNYIISTGGV